MIRSLLVSELDFKLQGYLISQKGEDYIVFQSTETGNEFELWEIGDWLQIRGSIFSFGDRISPELRFKIFESVNKLHDVAIGYRFCLDKGKNLVIVADILNRGDLFEKLVIFLDQAQFIIDNFLDFFRKINECNNHLTDDIIDAIFEKGILQS